MLALSVLEFPLTDEILDLCDMWLALLHLDLPLFLRGRLEQSSRDQGENVLFDNATSGATTFFTDVGLISQPADDFL